VARLYQALESGVKALSGHRVVATAGGAPSMDSVMGGNETRGAGSVGEERRRGLLGSSGGVRGTVAHQPVADSLDGWRRC
jgi:hypothetical protein